MIVIPHLHPASLNRRTFFTHGSAALLGSSAFINAVAQATTEGTGSPVQVETKYGRLRGTQERGLATFRGIPYAGSVSGANRFKAAPPVAPWRGVRDALQLERPRFSPAVPPAVQNPRLLRTASF